ncbi:unnamed protein product [Acanthosepion pharaonis]|uniref:Uncharacterized protein n=1 Tax=Acanthosepion pharaonis TaxID=158019 RepID=A0A812EVQ8_ACAPH|nr:unnamed protein product [Sepia pharaonis]
MKDQIHSSSLFLFFVPPSQIIFPILHKFIILLFSCDSLLSSSFYPLIKFFVSKILLPHSTSLSISLSLYFSQFPHINSLAYSILFLFSSSSKVRNIMSPPPHILLQTVSAVLIISFQLLPPAHFTIITIPSFCLSSFFCYYYRVERRHLDML